MNKIKIIADSTCDLELEYIRENNIEIIPLGVNFKDSSFKDGVDFNTKDLYEYVDEHNELPKTSAPSINEYKECFARNLKEGYDLVVFTISSLFSSSFQNAFLASEIDKERIKVIDSKNLSSGIGLIIVKTCKYIKEGMSLNAIASLLEDKIIPNVRSQFVVDTLEYLYKGGRCSSLSYIFGKHLHIHPIIRVVDGKMIVYKKPRGKMQVALNTLLNIFKDDLKDIDEDVIMITHSFGEQYEDYLKKEVEKLTKAQIMITHAGCVVSSHCGKGTIGILYIKK